MQVVALPIVICVCMITSTKLVLRTTPVIGTTAQSRVPPEWHAFRGYLQSDFRPDAFWVKHTQLALNLLLAASLVWLSDGQPWQQYTRLGVNAAGVVGFFAVLVSPVCLALLRSSHNRPRDGF